MPQPVEQQDEAAKAAAQAAESAAAAGNGEGGQGAENTPPAKTLDQVAGNGEGEDEEDGEPDEGEKPEKGKKKSSLFGTMMDLKQENRELKTMIREEIVPAIKRLSSSGGGETPSQVQALAEKYELKPEFVQDMLNAAKNMTSKEVEEKYQSEIKKITETNDRKDQAARLNQAIENELARVVTENPELEQVIKKDAVKKYILKDSGNRKKSMEDIIEEIYGNVMPAKKSIEGYRSQGGNHKASVNWDNLTDEDHTRIAQDPALREQYGEQLIDKLSGRTRHK